MPDPNPINQITQTQWLALTGVAAIITTAGNLIATGLKDFLFARSFERWKDRRTLLTVYHKYRDPLMLTGSELETRLKHIIETYPPTFLRSEVLKSNPPELKANSADDPHFKKYRLLSTVYRLCAFLGWLELYRRDVTFLDTGQQSANRELQKGIDSFRNALAEGRLNRAENWSEWRDALIFREEQRAIGELMIAATTAPTIIGYGTFCTLFDRSTSDQNLWPLRTAGAFFLDLQPALDFRPQRLRMMAGHLRQIVNVLRPPTSAADSVEYLTDINVGPQQSGERHD